MFDDSDYDNARTQDRRAQHTGEHRAMNRRGFLAGLLTGAGALALSACGGGGSDGGTAETSAALRSVANAAITASPNGTTIPSATTIIDASGAKWTVSGGVVYRNGSKAGYTSQAALLLWYNSAIYQRNMAGNWWTWKSGAWVAVSGDPRLTNSIFYGINGHVNQGGPYATASMTQQLSYLSTLGVRFYRNDVWDAAGAANLATLAKLAAPKGIRILPCMTPDMSTLSGESDAYALGYSLGTTVARALKGLVTHYECGNELETFMVSNDGNSPADYNGTQFAIARGLIRGMFDGVKAIDASAHLLPAPAGWLHWGFYDMLWNGTAPDGSSGYPLVRWDVTPWHWYSDMGDITNASGGSGTYNVLQMLQQRYGKPIWLTEYGVRPSYGTDIQIASCLTGNQMLGQFASIATQYGVQSVMLYELFDDQAYGGDGNYGVVQSDAVTLKPEFSALKTFIAAHPM